MLRIRKGYRTGKCRRSGCVKLRRVGRRGLFQFPSNGKAYPKLKTLYLLPSMILTFQFPSNGKAYPKQPCSSCSRGCLKFQFPSNGKAYPKYLTDRTLCLRKRVSIPFKRESISKVITIAMGKGTNDQKLKFQFPSNGKAYPKSICAVACDKAGYRFNSLQTGKHIQSEHDRLIRRTH